MKRTLLMVTLATATLFVTANAKPHKAKVSKGGKHGVTHDSSYNKYKNNTAKKVNKDLNKRDLDLDRRDLDRRDLDKRDLDINDNNLERKVRKEAVKAVL